MLFTDTLKHLRELRRMLQKHIASALDIDTPMYSRIERGLRKAKREQVVTLAKILKTDEKSLLKLWTAERIYNLVKGEDEAGEILRIVEEKLMRNEKDLTITY